jgi:hypothetical protein
MELAVHDAQLVTGPSYILPDGFSLFFSRGYFITTGSSVGNQTIVDVDARFTAKSLTRMLVNDSPLSEAF